jgi:transcriptional regulator with XRE-family HTH domain
MSNNAKKTNDAAVNQLGLSLREIRKQRSMTLAEASERSGLPVSTLSKIENNRMSISYDKLLRICHALEVDIAQLFAGDATVPLPPGPTPGGRRSVTRGGEGYSIATANYAHLYPAADLLNKRIVPIIAEVRARSLKEFGDLIRHSGEEYAYVLEGTVDLYTDLYAPTRLETGDSIYFDSGMGHAYIAVSPGVCRVLSICSAEAQHLMDVHADQRDVGATAPARASRLDAGEPAARPRKSAARARSKPN